VVALAGMLTLQVPRVSRASVPAAEEAGAA
jgi:hypothetical protein